MFEMGAKFEDGWSLEKETKHIVKSAYKSYAKHQLYFTKQKRKAKVVTIVKPFFIEKEELESIFKKLKKKLATGGSIKRDVLEFQGDFKDSLLKEFKSLGFGVKE